MAGVRILIVSSTAMKTSYNEISLAPRPSQAPVFDHCKRSKAWERGYNEITLEQNFFDAGP